MSEYQYYEFRAIERELSEMEMEKLRNYSSRAEITPTSFVNEYSYGDFRGNENLWMEKYFDAFIYLANWGTHRLQLALPTSLFTASTLRHYCSGESFSVRNKSGKWIFSLTSELEGGEGWTESEGVLDELLPIRADLMNGDLRSLYLGWLMCAQQHELESDVQEPPVPPNLGKLSKPLKQLVEFLRIEPELLDAAAEASVRSANNRPTYNELAAWVASLSIEEKEDAIIRVLDGKAAQIQTDLLARFNKQRTNSKPQSNEKRRTVGELLEAAGMDL